MRRGEQLEAEGWTTVAEEYFALSEVEFYPLLYYYKARDVALVAVTTTSMPSFTGGIVMPEYKYTAETLPDPVLGPGYYLFPVRQYLDGEARIVYPPQWAEQALQPRP